MDRNWMYNKLLPSRRGMREEFIIGVNEFIKFALAHTSSCEIRCPGHDCDNTKFHGPEIVKGHLYRVGFTPSYHRWVCHGEPRIESSTSSSHQNFPMRQEYNHLNSQQQMVFDAAGPSFIPYWAETDSASQDQIPSTNSDNVDSSANQPNVDVDMAEQIASSKRFWDILEAANEPLWDGCEETQLSAVLDLLKIKTEFNLSENCYNKICEWAGKCMPPNHKLPADYYKTKKLVKELELPLQKIDICPRGCMLYWKDDIELRCCKFCNKERYSKKGGKKDIPHKQLRYLPIIPRLQRLYASTTTAKHMRWHAEHEVEDGIMCHPSDSETWKHFDQAYPEFASESRNVRLALCADGFTPFNPSGKVYSCWPIIVTPYNLPPSMCLKTPYMFLSMIIPGPRNPKKLIDICLQPLIEELMLLWGPGVPTFDISRDENFLMRASLLWTINDFPAYAMMSGWSTAGVMACPICMKDTTSFWLENSIKPSWFDCHRRFLPHDHLFRRNTKAFSKGKVERSSAPRRLSGHEICDCVKDLSSVIDAPHLTIEGYRKTHKWTKQSIFWKLPYWKTHFVHHNLDVMHIEKNVFDNVFNTVMDIRGKSKDTVNARKDISLYCDLPQLKMEKDQSGPKPKADYTLTRNQRRVICEWIQSLKFPDGYASNIGQCVQMDELKLIGMKSHDCHVFMQRLIPIAFREVLPEMVWGTLTELSQFFHSLCSPILSIAQMEKLEIAMPLILCKLEKIFPPSFFDSMEHVLIHLAYEAKVSGPVQYRWMYPFERFLHHLKNKVGNKARVEASICCSYSIEEIATLAEHYSKTKNARRQPQQGDEVPTESVYSPFSIFNYPGRAYGKSTKRWIIDPTEKHVLETFILLNCPEVGPYAEIFDNEVSGANDRNFDEEFVPWFKAYVKDHKNDVHDDLIKSLAHGPRAIALARTGYEVNGYNFQTLERGEGNSNMNSGVWIKGSNYNADETDFFGLIEEIILLEYPGALPKQLVVFKCRWFDPQTGMKVHKKYDLVDVHQKRFYKKNDPFILAQQAIQVFYASYPGATRERANWWAVCKTKARSTIEKVWIDNQEDAYQPQEVVHAPIIEDAENLEDPSEATPMDDEENDVDIQLEDDEELFLYSSSNEENSEDDKDCEDHDIEEDDDEF